MLVAGARNQQYCSCGAGRRSERGSLRRRRCPSLLSTKTEADLSCRSQGRRPQSPWRATRTTSVRLPTTGNGRLSQARADSVRISPVARGVEWQENRGDGIGLDHTRRLKRRRRRPTGQSPGRDRRQPQLVARSDDARHRPHDEHAIRVTGLPLHRCDTQSPTRQRSCPAAHWRSRSEPLQPAPRPVA